ncbi:UNVERIFIED_CONTAM: hypothetical protein K2H54_022329 [Gekko kuhli]
MACHIIGRHGSQDSQKPGWEGELENQTPRQGTEVLVQRMGTKGKRDHRRKQCHFAFAQTVGGGGLSGSPPLHPPRPPGTKSYATDFAFLVCTFKNWERARKVKGGVVVFEPPTGPLGIAASFCGLADISLGGGGGFPSSLALLHAS